MYNSNLPELFHPYTTSVYRVFEYMFSKMNVVVFAIFGREYDITTDAVCFITTFMGYWFYLSSQIVLTG
jgi:hypothetical protein